jgi:hypothetical protein
MDEDDGAEPDPTRTSNQLIVPWVMDRKNALLLQLAEEGAPEITVATVQYALKRGIESVYQLEESELLAEPLPDRKNRSGVLFYEATEGGAGVLTRLVHDEEAVARVAYAALKVLHFDLPAYGESLPSVDDLHDVSGTKCVAGCYRCVLSYYNQPDHLVIDRRDKAARALLLRLAGVKTQLLAATDTRSSPIGQVPTSESSESATVASAKNLMGFNAEKFGLPEPSETGVSLAETTTIASWKSKRIALVLEGVSPNSLIDRGFEVVFWPLSPSDQEHAVSRLASLLN